MGILKYNEINYFGGRKLTVPLFFLKSKLQKLSVLFEGACPEIHFKIWKTSVARWGVLATQLWAFYSGKRKVFHQIQISPKHHIWGWINNLQSNDWKLKGIKYFGKSVCIIWGKKFCKKILVSKVFKNVPWVKIDFV